MESQVVLLSAVGLPIGYKLTPKEEQSYFVYLLIAMVIETCKMKWKLDGVTIYKRLRDCGAIAWLSDGYNCLHTQSMDYIIKDIEDMIKKQMKAGDINTN